MPLLFGLHVQCWLCKYFHNANDISMDKVNTKVVDNYIILLVLKSHDSRPNGLGVMKLSIALLCFACNRYSSE
jgi:hypothetical protein